MPSHSLTFRVRYSEIDRLNTFYNSRALEWFELGRTEVLRSIGAAYAEMESQGVYLPLIEAHVNFLGRAGYDDLLEMHTTVAVSGKARLRFDVRIVHAAGGAAVAEGYTIHAVTGEGGRPTRPPQWLMDKLADRPR